MRNLIKEKVLKDFKKEILNFGISEIFFANAALLKEGNEDFVITSHYDLPADLIEKMERVLRKDLNLHHSHIN